MKEPTIKSFHYKGSEISYKTVDGRLMIYASDMGRVFNHRASSWTKNQRAKSLAARLAKSIGVEVTDVIQTSRKHRGAGTWLHFELAVEYAKCLSKEFASWLEDSILEILFNEPVKAETATKTTASPAPEQQQVKATAPMPSSPAPTPKQAPAPQPEPTPTSFPEYVPPVFNEKELLYGAESYLLQKPTMPDLIDFSEVEAQEEELQKVKFSELLNTGVGRNMALNRIINATIELFTELQLEIENQRSAIVSLNRRLNEQKSKVTYYDTIFKDKDSFTSTEVAAAYGKTAQWLNAFLGERKIQFRSNNKWIPCRDAIQYGYSVEVPFVYTDNNGKTQTYPQYRWTIKGRKFIHKLLTDYKVV